MYLYRSHGSEFPHNKEIGLSGLTLWVELNCGKLPPREDSHADIAQSAVL
ncbi:unnamed protein product [Chondrus crispus]|uniref:Uncharacterized protein n=1 Tax=Chondrus crispus TaxID=2769 RepID=R7Q7S6_CHOCR|nr:unnamed protein product [Chondrus crispus]CDF34079.1 unnamed protein product [Chondrus crispus]|eukprot:XP_005713898.1 unnamed protein product [Chondrus crispus]